MTPPPANRRRNTGAGRLLSVLLCLLAATLLSCRGADVRTGLDRIGDYTHLFENKHIGIVTNHTAYSRAGRHIIDVIRDMPGVTITALFGPEHGIRGTYGTDATVHREGQPIDGIPIYNLYGNKLKPTPEMLQEVDLLVFDIQSVGARFYTYIYTMAMAMEAAAENDIPFVVLDRPNPINGVDIEGNLLQLEFATDVGLYPIPVRHGMTMGELAEMINGEGWLRNGIRAELTVVAMQNWRRDMWYDDTGLKWLPPSPNMPTLKTATVYPGLCLLEGTNVSEGRGTPTPFLIFGAPWIAPDTLVPRLNALNLAGIRFEAGTFTPQSLPNIAPFPKLQDRVCHGARIIVTDRNQLSPYRTGLAVINTLAQLYPNRIAFFKRHFDRLCGTDAVRRTVLGGGDLDSLIASWQTELREFGKLREKYLLYD